MDWDQDFLSKFNENIHLHIKIYFFNIVTQICLQKGMREKNIYLHFQSLSEEYRHIEKNSIFPSIV